MWPILKGALVAAGSFVILGTVTAVWSNPSFIRMTPAGGWEIVLLGLLALLLGVHVAIRRPRCSIRSASVGSVAGFLGIACPTCNKILMLLLGGELLLTYYEPIRLYVAAAGVLILAVVTLREWLRFHTGSASEPTTPAA
jgi:hypothetical protein